MNYIRVYNELVGNAQTRQAPDCYTERHHIVPRCLGGSDEKENIVVLTAREHFIAHWLLWKIHGHPLAGAFLCMTRKGKGQERYFSSKGYDVAKRAKSVQMSASNKGNTYKLGKSESEETRSKKSKYHTGRVKPDHSHRMKIKLSCTRCRRETAWSVFTRDHINKDCTGRV